jgi:serine/threonine-protein kinase
MVGEVINNYRVVSLLGEGGMGAVYLAEHPFMGRKAAIKVLRRDLAEDKGLVERFMNEARAANAIRHPNIIDIIDVGRTPAGVPYLMMELLEGQSVAKRVLEAVQLPVDEAVEIGLQTAAALAAAHGKGIVHRDLKPDNLFLVPDESHPRGVRVKVLDFGIAKLRGDLSNVSAHTQAGALMGTPPYMSPEQCRGLSDEIDHRTDVYALGIILYELLCGTPPFTSPGWGDIVLAHLTKPPPKPSAKNAAVPFELDAVVLKALAKTREERFASMSELQVALRAVRTTLPAGPVARPALAHAATVTASGAPPAPTTTFRSAAAEISTETDLPPKGGRAMKIGGAVGVAAAAVGAVLFLARGPGAPAPSPTPVAAAGAPVAAPVVSAPPVVAPPPIAPTPPPAVAPTPPEPEPEPEKVERPRERSHGHATRSKVAASPKAAPTNASPTPAPAPTPAAPTPAPAPAPRKVEKW